MHNPSGGSGSALARGAVPFMGAAAAGLTEGTDQAGTSAGTLTDDEHTLAEWTEEDIVLLHWKLLLEVRRLAEPTTPLEEKYDTLRWIFTERAKERLPFSFVNCLRVVGCSPLSPIAYCGRIDAEELRDHIRLHVKTWLGQTLRRYPDWVREAISSNPAWVEANLARNPQWINEQLKHMSAEGDLFT
jgi:hypothetical protein